MSTARDKVGELGRVASEQYDTYIEENPLAVGAVALAIGAAVGFAIPSTSYEGQVLGPVRQNLIEQASEKASDLIDKGKDLVSEASKNISEAAAATAGAASGSGSGSSTSPQLAQVVVRARQRVRASAAEAAPQAAAAPPEPGPAAVVLAPVAAAFS